MSLVPLYRLQGHGDHFYTTSAEERDSAISQYGYVDEGIACYVNNSPEDASNDAADNESLWRDMFVSVLGVLSRTSFAPTDPQDPAALAKRASDIADACLITYSDAVRRLRGQHT